MEKLTYKQAFDKITEAYIKDEINPYNRQFCFCGTLVYTGRDYKSIANDWDYSLYNFDQLQRMEDALLRTIRDETIGEGACATIYANSINDDIRGKIKSHRNYENALFNGMCRALEVLKQIHKDRGENVEGFQFEKRVLVHS